MAEKEKRRLKSSETPRPQNFIHVDVNVPGKGHIAWIDPIPGIPNLVIGYGEGIDDALEDLRKKIEPITLQEESAKSNTASLAFKIYRRLKYMQEVPISMWETGSDWA